MSSRYGSGLEGEFEPGSRGRVLRNLLGIRRVGDRDYSPMRVSLTDAIRPTSGAFGK